MTINGNHSQQRDDLTKPSKSTSVTSNIGTALSVLTNNANKSYLSNSISLHADVHTLVNAQVNDHHLSTSAINEINSSTTPNNQGKMPVQATLSSVSDSTATSHPTDTENSNNQQIPKVKMRDHTAKKRKGLRDLKSRISLPPELKNSFSFTKTSSSTSNNQSSNIKSKNAQQSLPQRSSYYQTTSLSTQTLNHVLNQSNSSSLLRLSPSQFNTSINGQLSRNEQRLSMLDLGFGKIESYVKLEKLGEGNSIVE